MEGVADSELIDNHRAHTSMILVAFCEAVMKATSFGPSQDELAARLANR